MVEADKAASLFRIVRIPCFPDRGGAVVCFIEPSGSPGLPENSLCQCVFSQIHQNIQQKRRCQKSGIQAVPVLLDKCHKPLPILLFQFLRHKVKGKSQYISAHKVLWQQICTENSVLNCSAHFLGLFPVTGCFIFISQHFCNVCQVADGLVTKKRGCIKSRFFTDAVLPAGVVRAGGHQPFTEVKAGVPEILVVFIRDVHAAAFFF